jgi:hypothetical protein
MAKTHIPPPEALRFDAYDWYVDLDDDEKLEIINRHAEMLKSFQQEETISQYLRQADHLNEFAVDFLAEMLNPSSKAQWKFTIQRRKRGRPGGSEDFLYLYGRALTDEMSRCRNMKTAIDRVCSEYQTTRATILRGLKLYRESNNSPRGARKDTSRTKKRDRSLKT